MTELTAPASRPRAKKRAHPLTKLLLSLGLVPVLLLVAEFGFRVWLRSTGQAFSQAEVEAALKTTATPLQTTETWVGAEEAGVGEAAGGMFLHPYFGFDYPQHHTGIPREVRYYGTPQAAETFDILILGGSVAGQVLSAKTQIVDILSADPRFADLEVRIAPAARAGHKQPQQLIALSYHLSLGFRPDMVINIDGFNEVALGGRNARQGAHPLHPSMSLWGRILSSSAPDAEELDALVEVRIRALAVEEAGSAALERRVDRSAILSRIALSRIARLRSRALAAYDDYMELLSTSEDRTLHRGPVFEGDREQALRVIVDAWVRSSRSIRALCDDRSMYYLHVLQPTMFDEGSKPLTPEELRYGEASGKTSDDVRLGYESMRAAAPLLAAARVNFFDASPIFADHGERIYVDVCHVNEEGLAILAQAVGEAVLDALPAEISLAW